MRLHRGHLKLLSVAAVCVAIGVAVSAITSAGASTPPTSPASGGAVAGHHMRRGVFKRSVEGSLTIRTRDGYQTATFERGRLDSVDGQQLTLTLGGVKHPGKTMTVTIPSTAKVRLDRQPSTLSALKPGDRVIVLTLPRGTVVRAHTPRTA